ncbi:MAG TPA: universal stress protein [Mycobacteriales bacterium]|nr:universal stress protein [Mycobacteriales bacterium]
MTHRRPILVDIDGSNAGWSALRWAASEANRRSLPLQLICSYSPRIVSTYGSMYNSAWEQAGRADRRLAEDLLSEAIEWIGRCYPLCGMEAGTIEGDRVRVLLDLAPDTDSLVIGARSTGLMGFHSVDPVARSLTAHAGKPVILVQQEPLPAGERAPIVVFSRFDHPAGPALNYGFEHARHYNTRLRVVRWQPTGWWTHAQRNKASWYATEELLFDELATWRSRYPDVSATGAVRPAARLPLECAGAQLLIVGEPRNPRWYWRRPRELRTLCQARRPTASIPNER